MKMAASEALWETAEPAPFVAFALIDEDNRKNTYQLALPSGLSLLAYNSLNAPVKGMNDLEAEYEQQYGPGYYIPAVIILFWSFRLMVAIGIWLVLIAAINCWYWWKKEIEAHLAVLKITMWSFPLPYLAITLGWTMAEMGRQPWIVYGLQLTETGVSKVVAPASIWISLGIYAVVYAGAFLATVYILRKMVLAGPSM